ncbi:MAG: LTA synthase family protein [Pseudomonadales bacterium]
MVPGRFTIMLVVAGVYLLLATIVRLGLWAQLPGSEGVSADALPAVLAAGLLYDCGFLLLASLPCALILWLIPEGLWSTRLCARLVHGAFFCCIYTLGFVSVAEWLFWKEFQTRFNFIAVDYLVYRQEVTENIWESYPVAWLLSGVLVLSLAISFGVRRRLSAAIVCSQPFPVRTRYFFTLLALALLACILLDQAPREQFHNAYSRELASSGPFQFFAAFRNNELDYDQLYLTADGSAVSTELRHRLDAANAVLFDPDPQGVYRHIDNPGAERRFNVVLIMVESLSASYLTRFGEHADITPNLDRLTGKSLFFSNLYATGTRTTRGLEAVTLSMPPTPGRSIVKRLGRESGFWSLGNVLREKGYDSRFIYGGRGYFDNMNAFFAGNGYEVSDQSSVPDDAISFSNAWGMADEDLYSFALSVADADQAAGRPFFFHLMTTSNHRPYTYPEGRIPIPSGTGRQGAVMYTDFAIGQFLTQARHHAWFDNTLFVIVADHCAGSAGKESLPVERYHIPMWVYAPGHVVAEDYQRLASQIDVAPTLLGLMHMDYDSSAFGDDLLQGSPSARALIGNYQYLGLLEDQQMTILEPRRRVEQYDYASPEAVTLEVAQNSPYILKAQSYYQAAAWIYEHRLNDWERRQLPALHSG